MKTLVFLMMSMSINVAAQELLYKVKDGLSREQGRKLASIMSEYDTLETPQRKRKKSRLVKRMKLKARRSGKAVQQNQFKSKMEELKASGLFEYVEENTIEHEVAFDINDPGASEQWHHPRIDTLGAWDFTQGSEDVIVAVCDSGVDANHEDLVGSVLTGYNFVDENTNSSPSTSHGTLVAGLIAARPSNGRGGYGIAPKTKILPLRITNDGNSFLSTIVECIEYAADNGAQVINVSFTGFESQSIQAAGEYAKERGAILIYSAGNAGRDRSTWPDHKDVVGVGATTIGEERSNFSNFGPFIDLVAPGTNIYTTNPNSGYATVSGTSFSAPIVAGAAALLYSLNENATADEVERFLIEGAVDLGDEYVFGAGRLDINESVRIASEFWGGNRSPSSIIDFDDSRELVAPAEVTFRSNSFDSDGSIASKEWKINGESFSQDELLYEFSEPGVYNISLTVIDNEGAATTSERVIEVASPRQLEVSVADIGLTVFFTRSRARTEANIKIIDDEGQAVSNAEVLVDIDGSQFVAQTNSAGVAFFSTDYESRSHRFHYEVLSVSKEGYTYQADKNQETRDDIRARRRWWWFW